MQIFRRFFIYRTSFRLFSSTIVDVSPSTSEKELNDINNLMKTYNNTHKPIRTYALFQWMLNIVNIKPNFISYLHIIHACSELNNRNICQKIHEFITNDRTLSFDEYRQLQIKLIYMYAKIRDLDLAEQIFQQIRAMKNSSFDVILYGTMFKAYNMNGQAKKTIELYENDIQKNKFIELDPITATCVLNASSDCHRLDIGEHVHREIRRLKLLDSPNIRLATSIIDMYCHCDSIIRARELFNQFLPYVDHVTYSILMKTYLSLNQPIEVLKLFKHFQISSIEADAMFYLNIINTGNRLGLKHQAEYIHRSIPVQLIEKNISLQTNLIDMHVHCLQFDEANRLFHLIKHKDNRSLGYLLYGYAIQGKGKQALKLFQEYQSQLKFNEHVYQSILHALALSGEFIEEAREIYQTIPNMYKTVEIATVMVSILARAKLFDEVQLFIEQFQSISSNVTRLWSTLFLSCYHSNNLQYGKLIYKKINTNPFVSLLFADMTHSMPSNEVINYFRQQKLGKCWTEIKRIDQNDYTIHEFHDVSSFNVKLNVIIEELKSVGIDWQIKKNDLKELFCGHFALRLAIAENFVSTLPTTSFQLTKTKPICSICHEGIKQLTILRKCEIFLRDNQRVHHFHHGQCSCNDQF